MRATLRERLDLPAKDQSMSAACQSARDDLNGPPMLRPVRIICLRCPPPNEMSFGTKGFGETASMMGCRPPTMSMRPGSSTIVGRVQLFERATSARLKRQSAVAIATMVWRKSS